MKGMGSDPYGITLIIGLVCLFNSWYKKKKRQWEKKAREAQSPYPGHSVNYNVMMKITEAHKDCTAEVISLMAKGRASLALNDMQAGERVWLDLERNEFGKNEIAVSTSGNRKLGNSLISSDSLLPKVLEEYIYYEAYLGGREILSTITVASIIVFFKIDGVAPTHVNLVD